MKGKRLLLLAAVMLMLTGLCVGALAQEETATITVRIIDPAVNRLVGRKVRLAHGECMDGWHNLLENPQPCDCIICPCGEEWIDNKDYPRDDGLQDRDYGRHGENWTVTIRKGHIYTLSALGGRDYVSKDYGYIRNDRRVIDWTGDSIQVYRVNDRSKTNLNADGSNIVTFEFEPLYTPVSFNFSAVKTMDGGDPGDLVFNFKVWELTKEQMEEVFSEEDVLTPEYFPEIPQEAWENPEWMPPEEYIDEFMQFLEEEIPRRMVKVVREKLESYPAAETLTNEGRNVNYTTREFTFYDLDSGTEGTRYTEKYYVFAEMKEPDQPICYDDAVYALTLGIQGWNPPTPVSLADEDGMNFSNDEVKEEQRKYREPLRTAIRQMGSISTARGWEQIDSPTEADLASKFIFANRTCPFYNPDEPDIPDQQEASAMPQTGDSGHMMMWLLLAAASAAALLALKRNTQLN